MQDRQFYNTLDIALIVCRNNEGKWLAVNESKNRGWWLPGGRVDPPEDHYQAAVRETIEEAGIDAELKGVLRVEYATLKDNYQRFKVVFYAEPKDPNQKPKSKPDKESLEARWVTIEDLVELSKSDVGLRGPELYEWATHIENGGVIYPLSVLTLEGAKVRSTSVEEVVKFNKSFQEAATYIDAKEVAIYEQAMSEGDDSWFFHKDASSKLDRLVDQNENTLLALALSRKNTQFIKLGLLMSKKGLFRVNSANQSILMIAIDSYYDKSIFENTVSIIKNICSAEQIEELFKHTDKSAKQLKDYIAVKDEEKEHIISVLIKSFSSAFIE